MGFSIEQARVALAATSTGLDVQAALETLLSNGAGSESPPRRPRDRNDESYPQSTPPRQNSHLNPISAPTRERLRQETPSPSGSQQERNKQADKLLTQASEIGLSVFNRANAFWNQSKEKVQKVYEERAKGTAGPEPALPARPRWMQDGLTPNSDVNTSRDPRDGLFSDFSDDVPQVKPTGMANRVSEPRQNFTVEPEPAEPAVYQSPYRRGRPSQAKPSVASELSSQPHTRASTPIQLIQRQTVSASQSVIASSAKHKATGTEKFKLGQFAAAEAAYTAAISVLPSSHLLLVPLYNNRALTRIKTGDCAGAIEDCDTVVAMIGPAYHPKKEMKVTVEEEGASVDLGDGLIKAWKRRAEACEGREKWASAQTDWEAVAAADWIGPKLRGEAVQGAGRCRRMASASKGGSKAAPPASTKKPPPRVRPPVQKVSISSGAVEKLRDANLAAEAEDQARYELKDTVDARLIAWKGGKETNIRALIASLDSVLWPELGWQTVGMAELVTPGQVKVRYTKAIAKLHPDKVRVIKFLVRDAMY
jgi:hypothetical protein